MAASVLDVLSTIIFDLGGTLVRSNELAMHAWQDAFLGMGYRVSAQKLRRELGHTRKALLRALIGEDETRIHGDRIASVQKEAFRARAFTEELAAADGAAELLDAVDAVGLRSAVVTTGESDDLTFVDSVTDLRLRRRPLVIVTSSDVPAAPPDEEGGEILAAACTRLAVDPLSCVLVGDSVMDGRSARSAGVSFIGVDQGIASPRELLGAGARFVSPDLHDLTERLPNALHCADSTKIHFDTRLVKAMMSPALAAAEDGIGHGEVPAGTALYDASGALMVQAHDSARATGDVTAHAEMTAFRQLRQRPAPGSVLVSTLEPCVMCLAAAVEVGVDVVVYGMPSPMHGGSARVPAPRHPAHRFPRIRGPVRAGESRALMARWLKEVATPEQRSYAEHLLAEAG